MSTRPGRLRLLVAVTATLVIVVPLARLWYASLIPSTYSMESMGYADLGGGMAHAGHHAAQGGATDVSTLKGPVDGTPDVALTLTARRGVVTLADGRGSRAGTR